MSGKHPKNSPQKYYKILISATFLGIVAACSTTRKVPDGHYLLTKNNFEFDGKKVDFSEELEDRALQKPNKKFLWVAPVGLWLYNMATPKYDSLLNEYMTYPSEMRNQKLRDSLFQKYNMPEDMGKKLFWNTQFHRFGKAPTILDESRTETSAENMRKRLVYRGYWDAEVKFSHKLDSTAKKAQANYHINPKDSTIISDYYYDITDEGVKSIYENVLTKSLVRSNQVLDQTVLEKEVNRINSLMKDNGYYKFNAGDFNQVYFIADSLKSRKNIPVTLTIKKDSADSKFKVATFGNVDIAIVDERGDYPKNTFKDSLRRINFHKIDNRFKTSALWRQVIINPGKVYDQEQLDITKRNILATNNFSIIKAKDSLRLNGQGTPNDSIVDVFYELKPLDKFFARAAFDANYSQLFSLGASPSVELLTRNVFGGMENLNTSISGLFGRVKNPRNVDKRLFAYELSAQTSLSFPKLLLPFQYYKLIPKRYTPTSSIVLGVTKQHNIGLGRFNINTGLNYQASVNNIITHKLTIFNTQFSLTQNKEKYYDFFTGDDEIRRDIFNDYFIQNPDVKQAFDAQQITIDEVSQMIVTDVPYLSTLDSNGVNLFNNFLQSLFNKDRQTQDVLISSMIYNFVYDEIGKKDYTNPFYFSGKVELAGNILSLFNQKRSSEDAVLLGPQRTIFGIPYSQFAKFDFDIRKYYKVFNDRNTFIARQFIGLGIPYGNSSSMPFVRSYFNGGANDIRAWVAFGGLGPSDSQLDERIRTYAMGNVKLTTNFELRSQFNDMFEGAIFIDIGNTWSLKDNGFNDQFKFNRFLKQVGIGSGVGIRMNLASYIIIRLDFAYKMYDPNQPEGERWRLDKIKPLKPTLNFAFGYPF